MQGTRGPLPFYVTATPPFTARTLAEGTVHARLLLATAANWQILKDFGEPFMVVQLVISAAAILASLAALEGGYGSFGGGDGVSGFPELADSHYCRPLSPGGGGRGESLGAFSRVS